MDGGEFDAQLHLLRSAGRLIDDPRHRRELESARFNLFAALQQSDSSAAIEWIEALEVGFHAAKELAPDMRASIERALTLIRRGVRNGTQKD